MNYEPLNIDLHGEVGRLSVALGACTIWLTGTPFPDQVQISLCYAVLADWLSPSAPVGMFVNFYVPPGSHSIRESQTVFAAPAFRLRPAKGEPTVAVTIGKWLFDERHLTRHSPDRTDSGDRWARAVGGNPPDRDQKSTDEAIERTGAQALARLNALAWPRDLWMPSSPDH